MAAPILSYEDLGLIQGEGWLFRGLDVYVGQRDRCAFASQKLGGGIANPARATHDQASLSLNPEIHDDVFPLRSAVSEALRPVVFVGRVETACNHVCMRKSRGCMARFH